MPRKCGTQFFMTRVGSHVLMKQNFRRPLIFGLLFIVYLGAIRLLHEVCMPGEDGNLLVNGGLALLLSAATYLIWRGLRSLRKK